jgi:hypothetical protein
VRRAFLGSAAMRNMLCALLLACLSLSALATDGEVRTINVTGAIVLDAQGKVKDVKLDGVETPAISALVERAVRHWTFEPVLRDGVAIEARTGFWLEVRATPVDNGYATRIARVSFRNIRHLVVHTVMMPPSEVLAYGGNAEALAALRADSTGRITDIEVIGLQSPEGRPLTGRQATVYARYVVAMIRKWKFEPADPEAGSDDTVDGLLPISISLRGPRPVTAPWVDLKPVPWHADKPAPDASQLQPGAIAAVDDRIKLRDQVVGTAL